MNAGWWSSFTWSRLAEFYQSHRAGLEAHVLSGKGGWNFFLYYNIIDSYPFRPRQGLLEAGMRFYL